MKKVLSKIALSALALTALQSNLLAAQMPTVESYRVDTQAYAAVGLYFGNGTLVPYGLVGARRTTVDTDNIIKGADASLRINFKNSSVAVDSTRLSWLYGNRNLYANTGVGYSFDSKSWLGTLAAEGDYYRVGSDYLFTTEKFNPYIEAVTIGKPDEFKKQVTTTPPPLL